MSLSTTRAILIASATLLLSGLMSCSVYVPLQPSAPLLRNKGESEVAASLYLSGRLEGSVAYSPAKHVLVRAAGGLQANNKDSVNFQIRQFELGAGTYRSLSDRWLVGAMGGYGRGQGSRRFKENAFEYSGPDPVIQYNYSARFHKLHAEGFVAYEGEWATLGAAYRLSQVRFSSLTNNGLQIDMRRMTRSEPMLFMRFGNRTGFIPWGQFQLAFSTSWSPDYDKNVPIEEHRAYIKESRLFTSVGFVIYPHRFKKFSND